MPLMTSAKGGADFEPIPEGTYVARCVRIIDLGQQKTTWNGQDKFKHKVVITFEVPAIRVNWTDKDDVEHEGPALISSWYTNSISDRATLGQHLTSWRGKAFTEDEKEAFDLFTILDKGCQISVTHNAKGDKVYANIAAIMGLPTMVDSAGKPVRIQPPERETDLLKYSPHDPESAGNFDKLSDRMKEVVTQGHEILRTEPAVNTSPPLPDDQKYAESNEAPPLPGDFDDDIPF